MLHEITTVYADLPPLAWPLIAIGATLAGFFIDVIMRDRGFGPYGNGFLITLGVLAGLDANAVLLLPFQARDPVQIIALAAGSALAILMSLGLVKRWL